MTAADSKRTVALLERIGRLLTTEAHADGLLPVHWETLRYLARANRFSQNAAALTAYLGLTKGTVSQTLGTLENKGLVKKTIAKQDRRSKRLSLTAKGKRLLKRDPIATTGAALADLSESRQLQLARSLEAILSARLAAQDRQPFGQCRDCEYFAPRHKDGAPHFCRLLEEQLSASDADSICYEQRPAQQAAT